jgi:hypothetical protein
VNRLLLLEIMTGNSSFLLSLRPLKPDKYSYKGLPLVILFLVQLDLRAQEKPNRQANESPAPRMADCRAMICPRHFCTYL